ncbi:MAG: hypothetical protein CM15mV13_3110 [uncultured marine virus]|nr:MAG: hypothetical protein CM15mV13_3110 [uncultured marine virus]
MAAEGSYNPATKILTITGDGMPNPVSYGTFPNVSNPYTPAAYTFNHSFLYRVEKIQLLLVQHQWVSLV